MSEIVVLDRTTPLETSGRDDTIFRVAFAACDDDTEVITDVWRMLHDRLIASEPVRYGRVQGWWYRADASRSELEEAGVTGDVLEFIAGNPGTVAVVAMVEVPARG